MNFDKRSALRIPLQQNVDIYRRGTYIGRGKTKNIHIDGAYINACPGTFSPNEVLQLRFYLGENGQQPVYLKGMIVHGSSEGLGILFSYTDQQFKTLKRNLYGDYSDQLKSKLPA